MKKVLFFCAWFPNKNNSLAGKFIIEQAKSLDDKIELAIFYIYDDYELESWYKFEEFDFEGIKTYKISFKRFKSPLLFSLNILYYFLANIVGYLKVKQQFGIADLNHVHVLTKTAILPYFLKLINKTPYVISEHWSRYLPERNSYHGAIRKWITKRIVKNSDGLCTVSQGLMDAMENHGLRHENSLVISNTISDNWFADYEKKNNETFNFLHVSGIQDSIKNVTGILRATNNLKKSGLKFKLDIVGDDDERTGIENYAKSLLLEDCVKFWGKLYGDDLIRKYQNADVFVLFSNFETQSCVLLEAFANGIPVIATKVGGIPEIVNSRNGILVAAKDEKALAEAMKDLVLGNKIFDSTSIKKEAKEKHGHEAVAKKFLDFYKVALS
jgi:glycosyltransferase involved in cell wall biosynthesis